MNSKIPYCASDVSSFFIRKGVSSLKLQKLLYYAQIWFFVIYKKHLFNDKIQGWIYGPAIYSVWNTFKYMKKNSTIPKSRANDVDLKQVEDFLNELWQAYGHLSSAELVDLTHNELPWLSSRNGLLKDQPGDNEVIIDEKTTIQFKLTHDNKIPYINKLNSLGHFSNT